MSSYIPAQDFRRNTSTGVEINYFPSTNSSYCDASDAKCTTCLHNAIQVTHLSGFCVGKDDCVCVAICELSQWQTLAQMQLPFAMAAANETSVCTLSVSTTEPSSSSLGPIGPTPAPRAKKQVLAVEDRCTWYTNQTRCGLPRTCYDCLNVPLENGDVRFSYFLFILVGDNVLCRSQVDTHLFIL